MLVNPNLEKYAKVIVDYSLYVKKDEKIKLTGYVNVEPLLKEIYKQLVKKGAHVKLYPVFDDFEYVFFNNASKEQIEYLHPIEIEELKYWDGLIVIGGKRNLKSAADVNPELLALSSKTKKPLMDLVNERENKNEFKWSFAYYPTFSSAQEANMSIDVFSEYLLKTCKIFTDNPTEEWEKLSKFQAEIIKKIDNSKKVKVIGEDTELEFSIEGRKWVNCDGKQNMPDGEIFTTPVENSINGKIRYTYPGIYAGNEVEDITLEFKDGKVINANAKKGEEVLRKLIETDEGASRVGEFAIGTNAEADKFVKNMLFDEKMKGTIHLALGTVPGTGTNGVNKSAIHWDMLKDMRNGGRIFIDDKLIYKNGDFTI